MTTASTWRRITASGSVSVAEPPGASMLIPLSGTPASDRRCAPRRARRGPYGRRAGGTRGRYTPRSRTPCAQSARPGLRRRGEQGAHHRGQNRAAFRDLLPTPGAGGTTPRSRRSIGAPTSSAAAVMSSFRFCEVVTDGAGVDVGLRDDLSQGHHCAPTTFDQSDNSINNRFPGCSRSFVRSRHTFTLLPCDRVSVITVFNTTKTGKHRGRQGRNGSPLRSRGTPEANRSNAPSPRAGSRLPHGAAPSDGPLSLLDLRAPAEEATGAHLTGRRRSDTNEHHVYAHARFSPTRG